MPGSEETISYTYDANDRLTGAAYASGDSYTYAYDAVGNRTALETVLGGVSDSTSYTYDAGDRIAKVDDAITYDYDNRGNLTSDGAWTYAYDGAGRMVRAARAASVYTYVYNGDGLLVSETIDGVETVFTWDQAAGLPQVLATSDGTKNLYGLERIGVEQGGAWRYPLPDALGSVRQWTDPAGAVLAAQSYGPFGEPRDPLSHPQVAAGTPPWGRTSLAVGGVGRAPKGFTGEWQDPVGMVNLRARWYNPALGRFTQVDPAPGSLALPATLHPYTYADNQPMAYVDPSGPELEIAVIGIAAVLVVAAVGFGYYVAMPRGQGRSPFGEQLVPPHLELPQWLGTPGEPQSVEDLYNPGPSMGEAEAGSSLETLPQCKQLDPFWQLRTAYGVLRMASLLGGAWLQNWLLASRSYESLADAQREIERWGVEGNLTRVDEHHQEVVSIQRRTYAEQMAQWQRGELAERPRIGGVVREV